MDNNDEKFWLSIIKKYENRKLLLEEQQCNLEQRLGSLKRRISSSQNDICSCCSQCFEATPASSRMNTSNATSCCPTGTLDDLSTVSVNSIDVQYIAILNDLINREKQLKKQVRDMELREQDLLKHTDQTFGGRNKSCCNVNNERDPITTYGKDTQKLLDDNARLSDELEDVKLELKHCMEKFQGPLTRTLDQERRRSQQLENDLKAANEAMATKECCYREDMCCLKNHLAEVMQNLADMTRQNENVQRQSCSLGRKYKDLQRDLISQKLNEARTLERLNELLSEKERTVVRDRRQHKSQETQKELDLQIIPQKEEKGKADVPRPRFEHNLYAIARGLSKTLLNINKCDICRDSIPEDLKDTITGIKVITDIVDHGNPNNVSGNLPDTRKPPDTGPDNGHSNSPKGFHGPKTDASGKTEDDFFYGDTGKNNAIEDITDATDISTDASIPEEMNDEYEAVKEIGFVKTLPSESIHVLTEVEALDDLQVQVDTQVEFSEEITDDIHVTTTVTNSGMLEVVTEGPAGLIETTMIRTPSGNFEVVTEITEYPEYLSVAESGDTSHDLDNIVTDVEEKELELVEKVGDFIDSINESINESVEEEEFFSIRETDMSEGADLNKPNNLQIETIVAFVQCVEGDRGIMDVHNRGKLEKSLLTPIMEDEEAKSEEKMDLSERSSIHGFSYSDNKVNVEQPKAVLESFAETENAQELSLSSITEEVALQIRKRRPGPIPSVTSDIITSDRSKFRDSKSCKKNRKTFMSKIPVSASFPYQGPICNCDKCGCVECFGRIISEGHHGEADGLQSDKFGNLPNEVSSVASTRQKKPHPPDCDCVDCLCDPCASFPPDYATRVHPDDCDCVDCLCDEFPCAPQCTEKEIQPSGKSITEPSEHLSRYEANKISEPVLDKTPIKPIDVPITEPVNEISKNLANEFSKPVLDKTQTKEIEVPIAEPAKNPTPINEISKNLANEISKPLLDKTQTKEIDVPITEPVKNPTPINEISPNLPPSTLRKAISENWMPAKELSRKLLLTLGGDEKHQKGCECGSCVCCKCNEVRSPAPDRCEVSCDTNHHLPNCSCIECLLVCGIPNKTKERQKADICELSTVSNTPSDGSSCDCAECGNVCTSPSCGQIKKIIPPDNRKAELQELQVCLDKIKCACLEAETTACCNRIEKKGSGQNLLETLKGIIANLQSRYTGKSMADIANELKSKVNNVLFEKLLPTLAPSRDEIYSCACVGEKKDKRGVYLPNTCSCGIKTDNKNIASDSSSCSCFDIVDEKSENVLPSSQSDESCHCSKSPGKDIQVSVSERKTPSLDVSLCSCTSCEELKPQLICKQENASPNSSSIEITEVRKVSSDGLLIKWLPSTRKDVTGYEILIDGKTKSKVRNAVRTSAIIYSVAIGTLNLSVYAITPRGRCQPPANAMYEF
ncbi:hypothetical protein RI129_011194 [Pyrocoelia pectoralis]|uniref:Uncharacterized protein n=1 Tax=Pyrocoelia pectoralis TaxID=417401 RepID=A0AAN7V7G8_9COLE